MSTLITFLAGFTMSFVGSIPPGTLNLSVLQLGLDNKMKTALRFAVAAALVEYPYAWIAIGFQEFIMRSKQLLENMELISAIVLLVIGVINLIAAGRTSSLLSRMNESGFRRGVILSVLNPLALPFWIGMTAYLKSVNVISLKTAPEVHAYLSGITLGAFFLLLIVAYSAKKMVVVFKENSLIKKIPGIVLVALGLFGLADFFFP
jgi:threonine/homoserine/homoserine lactone efflux protein